MLNSEIKVLRAAFEKRSQAQPNIRLVFLDGMRGLTSFYVVLVHAYREIDAGLQGDGLPLWLYWATRWMTHGRNAVSIFIVLSGFCLMTPVVLSQNGQLRGGILQYLKRRAWRILPPYYMALILLLLLFATIPQHLQDLMGVAWNESRPALATCTILSHLFLIHNLNLSWIYKIEIPMWSVATEWQIYFVFPLLLLIWRRLNSIATIGLAFVIGLAPHFLSPNFALDSAVPWFLGLFALGMGGAELVFSQKRTLIALRQRMPWRTVSIMTLVGLVIEYFLRPSIDSHFSTVLISDLLVGILALSVIVHCASCLIESRRNRSIILSVLESKWAVLLGTFSYSLYLIHLPILGLIQLPLTGLHTPGAKFLGLLFGGVPLALLASYGFYLLCEKPFLVKVKRKSKAYRVA